MMSTPIFVTGTGRSGTWLLYRSLNCHPDVHIFPKETRFLIDPDGLRDLNRALTTAYHPVQASEALYRFERLMSVYLAEPEQRPYRGFDLPAWIGPEYYRERLNGFLSQLVDHTYQGRTWHVEPENEGRLVEYAREIQALRRFVPGRRFLPYQVTLPRDSLKVGRYFSDQKELTALSATFVDDIFSHAARTHGKRTWADKTPQHLLCLDFLWGLFPNAAVIHIKRDPRGVVHSLTKQPWAPSDVHGAALWLRRVFERWFDLRRELDLDTRPYLEVKLEDFAAAPREWLCEIAQLCGLDDRFERLPDIEIERVTNWQKEMPADAQATAVETLNPYLEQMGYRI